MCLFPTDGMRLSLLSRAFLLVATLMLMAVAAWLAIFREADLDRRSHQIAQMVTSVTNLTRAALVAADPAHRHDLLAELAEIEGVRIYPADTGDRIQPPPPRPLIHRIETLLRERLGPETQLAFGVNDEQGLFVRFRIFAGAEGDFWLALPRDRLERRFPWQWLGWGAAVLLLSLAGAWLIVYRIVRPLEDERALLLAGISHDLRTPLTRLRMEMEMSVTDAEARAGMEADIAEMDCTIGQFLDFARPKAGDTAPPEPLAIATLLDEIAARYGDRLRRVGSADFRVRAHAGTLRRAIVNLIENALRHGGGTAPVELGLTAEGKEIIIAVLDRGPGIPPDQIARLKQPFTRGEAARTGAGGAGLGLAIVERIIRGGGGRLELLPREGGGLAARIRLPRA
jgi:two-component system osmolarity sensor histidine kinase EnvZ